MFEHLAGAVSNLFNTEGFTPRWFCGQWSAPHGWVHIVSDLATWGAYTTIPFLLSYFITRRKDIPFPKIFILFAAFIFACGTVHLIEAIIFWHPVYRLSGLVKLITAVVSWGTVAALIPILPKAFSLRSPKELEHEVRIRERAEAELKRMNENLEKLVSERTLALQEKAQQLESANKEMESFNYMVSHDLRAPLRKICMFSDMLKQTQQALNSDGQDYVQRITNNVQQMDALIDDLLTLSRLTSADFQCESVNLSALATKLLQELQEQDPERRVTIHIEPDIQVIGDPLLLCSILENLLGNAWKFTSKKSDAMIEFGQFRQAENNRLVYYVKDNGAGFNAATAEKLFSPFQRFHLSTDFPGTGIGLASVNRAIQKHAGQIWADSTEDQGATFYFTLGIALEHLAHKKMSLK